MGEWVNGSAGVQLFQHRGHALDLGELVGVDIRGEAEDGLVGHELPIPPCPRRVFRTDSERSADHKTTIRAPARPASNQPWRRYEQPVKCRKSGWRQKKRRAGLVKPIPARLRLGQARFGVKARCLNRK